MSKPMKAGSERPTWGDWALDMARVVATRAACSRRQVGAVILDETHSVIGVGYNGVPRGELNCSDGGCPRGQLTYDECPAFGQYNNCKGIHAEDNALREAQRLREDLSGCTIYITCKPCQDCDNLIKQSGIDLAVWHG